jgi:hypothetical protein
MNDVDGTPILPAFRIGRQLVVYCRDCRGPHYHGSVGPDFGAGDGHRVAHCGGDGPLQRTGYIVKEAPPQRMLRPRRSRP